MRAGFEQATNGDKPNNININAKNINVTSNNNTNVNVNKRENNAMEAFLDSFSNKNTKRLYKHGIELFIEFYGKDIDTILNERKADLTPKPNENIVEIKQKATRYEKHLERFHSWMLKTKGFSINTARSNVNGILQLFRYYSMPISLRSGSPITQTVVSTKSYILTPDNVRAMFHVAKDLRSKLLVTLGKDLGWRISDVLNIKRNELPDLQQEPPITWLRITRKEKQVSKTCLSRETVQVLKEYLFSFAKKDTDYLFHSNGSGHIEDDTVNRRLKDLAEDSGIKVGNSSLSWHCFRKMIISQAKNLGIDADIIKLMVGKSVNKAMLTYMTGVDVKSAFNKLQTLLEISLVVTNGKQEIKTQKQQIEQLEKAIVQLQNTLTNQDTINTTLTKQLRQQESHTKELHKQYVNLKNELHKTHQTFSKMLSQITRDYIIKPHKNTNKQKR